MRATLNNLKRSKQSGVLLPALRPQPAHRNGKLNAPRMIAIPHSIHDGIRLPEAEELKQITSDSERGALPGK